MTRMIESNLEFSFNSSTLVFKYDQAPAYKNHLTTFAQIGRKGVDFIAINQNITWLIEVKNFKLATTVEDPELADTIATKIWDTLAGLHALKAGIVSGGDYPMQAKKALQGQLRVVFHREMNTSKWHNSRPANANMQLKLRQILKPFTKDIWVVDRSTIQIIANCCWTVQ